MKDENFVSNDNHCSTECINTLETDDTGVIQNVCKLSVIEDQEKLADTHNIKEKIDEEKKRGLEPKADALEEVSENKNTYEDRFESIGT